MRYETYPLCNVIITVRRLLEATLRCFLVRGMLVLKKKCVACFVGVREQSCLPVMDAQHSAT